MIAKDARFQARGRAGAERGASLCGSDGIVAICSDVIGRQGDMPGVWMEPVSAQLLMVLFALRIPTPFNGIPLLRERLLEGPFRSKRYRYWHEAYIRRIRRFV
ncbi:hypothetical protein AA309_12255 [Microvirga vignae]|uniref:Uncharacterized protein n=1 Tax=Microvirga vignae TaxID=1225564 RepID=A0A0H1RCU8_9HYPH|nr:hypothetical protein AA309_12255 [Microvirga vignae]